MAKFNAEALSYVREQFDNGHFIIIEGQIFKEKQAKYFKVNIGNKKYTLKTENVTKSANWTGEYLLEGKVRRFMSKTPQSVIDEINSMLSDGAIAIRDKRLYKPMKSIHERGYILFSINYNDIEYRTFAHRIVYFIAHSVWDEDRVINHKDRNKSNNRIENMELISQFDNILYFYTREKFFSPEEVLHHINSRKYELTEKEQKKLLKMSYTVYRRKMLRMNCPKYIEMLCTDFKKPEDYIEHLERYRRTFQQV